MTMAAVNPTDAATGIARQLKIRWSDDNATVPYAYKVYFDDTEEYVSGVSPSYTPDYRAYRGDVSILEYDPVIPLDYYQAGVSGEYFWRVIGIDENGDPVSGSDSGTFSFTTISAPTSLTDATYSTLLCCAANNKFWYEDKTASPPVMVELSGLTLDTSVPITMWEAYQRVFIANGIYKKVVDFVNTKLVIHSSYPITVPPTRGDIIVGATSGAQMLVDFVPKDMSAIYGSIIAGTFSDGESLSGGTLSGISSSPAIAASSGIVSAPHHYNWEPYADVNTTLEFGSMPDFIYSGCLYMGSILFGNNPVDPHFWGMTRQTNPFDFAYAADDVQSAVAAGGPRAGQIGDRVKTFIPVGADYLLIGCARSWMVLRGLPAAGGQLDLLDDTVGIIDKDAWCKGTNGEVYFLATTGLYRIQGVGKPMPLSHHVIPRLAEEMELNPQTQRITMGYDRNRHGLIISVVNAATGANQNYWYDLHTEGFFPEEYPVAMAPQSMLFYDAEDPDYRRLVIGGRDGYIRTFDNAIKSDDGETILSHVLVGPVRIGQDDTRESVVNDMQITVSGGSAGGEQPDSDDIRYEVFVGSSAETCLEKSP